MVITIRKDIVKNAFEDWIQNMNAGMSPKVARELVEYEYEYFSEDEKLLLSSVMMTELEQRMEARR